MAGPEGNSGISARINSMLGWALIRAVTTSAKRFRSTARAAPAGRAVSSAIRAAGAEAAQFGL
jgi:hypothetical protein